MMKVGAFDNYIGGAWLPASDGGVTQIKNPCDGEVVSQVAKSTLEDVNRAVAEAKRAFYEEDWAFNPRLRATVLAKWAMKMRRYGHRSDISSSVRSMSIATLLPIVWLIRFIRFIRKEMSRTFLTNIWICCQKRP